MNQAAQIAHFETTISPAEAKVIALLQQGMTNKEIGAKLFRSELTIKTHVEHILAKTGAKNRAQVCALWAMVAVSQLAVKPHNTPSGNQLQNTPNGVLGVVNAAGSIDVRSSGSNNTKGSAMRSLKMEEIIVVSGGWVDFGPPTTPPGGPAWPSEPPQIIWVPSPPERQPWELRQNVSPDGAWQELP